MIPTVARAQAHVRPGDKRPELPPFEVLERERGTILPAIELPEAHSIQGVEGGARLLLREVRITGNTALNDAELREVWAPYTDDWITFTELEKLRDELTLAYVARGYLTSGAVIPDQSLKEGVLEVQIVEAPGSDNGAADIRRTQIRFDG